VYNCVRYVCVCVRARVHKIYDGTWATHICLYILHTYICACVSLSLSVSLCDCLRVSYHVHLFTMLYIHLSFSHHPAYDADWFLAAPTLCLFVSYFGSFRSPLCYHKSKLAHKENQTSVHQRKHMSVHKVLWLPLAIRNAEQGLVANLDKNSARV